MFNPKNKMTVTLFSTNGTLLHHQKHHKHSYWNFDFAGFERITDKTSHFNRRYLLSFALLLVSIITVKHFL